MIGYLLFQIGRIGSILLVPVGLIYTIIKRLRRPKTLGTYFFNLGYVYDKLVNAACGDLLNDLLRKPGGYDYGNPDDTISRATGKNELIYKLKKLGIKLKNFLNKIDPGHTQRAAR